MQCILSRKGIAKDSESKKLLRREILDRHGRYDGKSLRGVAATSIGDYAIFAGGGAGSYKEKGKTRLGEDTHLEIDSYSKDVFVFDQNGHYTIHYSNLLVPRRGLAATSIGDYAIFAGGSYRSGFNWKDSKSPQNPYSKDIDVFKMEYGALVPHESTIELTLASKYVSAVTLGDYAIFASCLDKEKSSVDVFRNGAGGPEKYEFAIAADKLAYIMRHDTKGLVVGKYAIFASGSNNKALTFTVGNNKELELTPHGDSIVLPEDSKLCGAASVGNYAIFITAKYIEHQLFNELTVYELVNDQFVKKETKFNIYSSYSGIQSASSKQSAVFFGNNTNIYYIFTVNSVGELEMNEHNTDIVISQAAGTFVYDNFICLEGKSRGYVVSTYDF